MGSMTDDIITSVRPIVMSDIGTSAVICNIGDEGQLRSDIRCA